MKNKPKGEAIILCAHGSRDINYENDVKNLVSKLKKKNKKKKIFFCFIEKNDPEISKCVFDVSREFKKILFFPLLFFEGYHMVKDIRKEIEVHKKQVEIELLDKLSLTDDLSSFFRGEIKKKSNKNNNFLIVSCSKSSTNEVNLEAKEYLNLIADGIDNKHLCFVGEEKKILDKIFNDQKKNFNIIIHPIFFFDGFLYKKTLKDLNKLSNVKYLKPISHYPQVLNLISKRLGL